MALTIERRGKGSLTLDPPVMAAAGVLGFADEYKGLIKLDKLGALVTNPVTLYPRSPASGTRVIPLGTGLLVHSGLPNAGLEATLNTYSSKWRKLALGVVLHLVATTPEEVRRACERINAEEHVDAVELGIGDDTSAQDAQSLVRAARDLEKPVLARVPAQDALLLARSCAEAGADALVVSAPPRGTARDTGGRLISGRVYGPLIKPMALRLVGQVARAVLPPVIGAGGIHSPQDARDFLDAGAAAIQVDSVTWIKPQMLEIIARDLGGLVLTQPAGALSDEWHEGIGQTEVNQRIQPDDRTIIPKPKRDG